jgi:hypothetical protein
MPRLAQRAERPTIQLPRVSRRTVRYAACGVSLVAGFFLVRGHLHAPVLSKGAGAKQKLESKTFAWVPVSRARSYRVVFEQNGRVIYSSRTRQPRLRLRAKWTYRGHRHALYAGAYQWYVWPIFRTAKGSHRGHAVVDSTLTIPG